MSSHYPPRPLAHLAGQALAPARRADNAYWLLMLFGLPFLVFAACTKQAYSTPPKPHCAAIHGLHLTSE